MATKETGRSPAITLATVNLLKIQRDIREITNVGNTRNGIRVVTKETADYSAIMRHFVQADLRYFTL
jgi:hypothetical protein